MKLETIRQIVAIQLDAFFFKLNARTGPKNKPVIPLIITPEIHSKVSSLIPNKLETIGANIASETAQIPLKIMKNSIDSIAAKLIKF